MKIRFVGDKMRILVLLHGYGVRSSFWEPIITLFESKFPQINTPDLQMDNPTILVESTKQYILDIKKKSDADIYVIGHSLGGVVAILVAQELGPDIIKKIALLAVPYGEHHVPFKSLTRFLIKNRLIPDFLTRPRFFSNHTPKKVQKRLFKQVVPESEALIDEMLNEKYFHTDLVNNKLPMESIFFLSEYDKIAPYEQSLALATILCSKTVKYKKEDQVAHNDYVAGPTIAKEVAQLILDFFFTA